VEIVGVIKSIDPAAGRITINYEPVEALNWPAGTTPFVVSKTALLSAASVGQRVRFHLESQQIADLKPF
jgi:Cu(I)/Ag(I) efflux system protein CusF